MPVKSLSSGIETGDNLPMKNGLRCRRGVSTTCSIPFLVVLLATATLSACTKEPMVTTSGDGSPDLRWPGDAAPVEISAPADASSVSQPETNATVDIEPDRQPENGDSDDARSVGHTDLGAIADARVVSKPETGALADAGPVSQPEASTAVEPRADASTFSPFEAGNRETRDAGPEEVGSPVGAVLNITPNSVNFGTVSLGNSATATVAVVNTGTTASGTLTVLPSFGVMVTGCTGVLQPQASCTVTITVVPTNAGAFDGLISIAADPGAIPPLQVSVSGMVILPGQFTVSPAAINLGTIPAGVLAPPQTITVSALSSLTDLSVTTSGPEVTREVASTCLSTLPAGITCTVVMGFWATSTGSKSGSVIISAGGTTVVVPITATVVNPAKLVVTPTTAAFATAVNIASSPITIGVGNAGDIATGALSATITGPNAADFAVMTNTCTLLAPLNICAIAIVFTPRATSAAPKTASLTVRDFGADASTAIVALTGTAYSGPSLDITSAKSDLGTVPVGTTGAATAFTVTNTGDVATGTLTVSASSAEFVISGNTCAGFTLAPRGSCTVSLALKPTSIGVKAAVLTVSGTTGVPAIKQIAGTGISP